jgi:hypothetical protein
MDTAQILRELHAEREKLNQAIEALESLNGAAPSLARSRSKATTIVGLPTKPTVVARTFSPESRKHMAEAQKKRWAKRKRAAKAAAKKAASAAK